MLHHESGIQNLNQYFSRRPLVIRAEWFIYGACAGACIVSIVWLLTFHK